MTSYQLYLSVVSFPKPDNIIPTEKYETSIVGVVRH